MLMGIDTTAVAALAFAIGVATTGAGCPLISVLYPFFPASHYQWISRLLGIIVLGGMGSLAGATVGRAPDRRRRDVDDRLRCGSVADGGRVRRHLRRAPAQAAGVAGLEDPGGRVRSYERRRSACRRGGSRPAGRGAYAAALVARASPGSSPSRSTARPLLAGRAASPSASCFAGIMASGWNIISGFAGYVSLGQSAFMGLGAYRQPWSPCTCT